MPASVDKNHMPASFLYEQQGDPAAGIKGAPPNFGQEFLEHIHTVNGRYGLVSHSYLNQDEALNDSRVNAYRMRADCGVMESLEARQRATALLNWHIEPENTNSHEQVQLAQTMTDILQRTPRFVEMRRCLLEALWFGRYMTAATFTGKMINGHRRIACKNWEPRNGDKLKFRYADGSFRYMEGQVGLRVGTAYAAPRHYTHPKSGDTIQKIQPTEDGLVYWLDKWERDTTIVHKHMIEDGPYWEPRFAGRIHGVGIRDRIYWSWYAMVECLQRVVEYLDRAAFGIEVWPYPAGNPVAKQRASDAAQNAMGGGRTIILAPLPQGEDAELYLPKLIEPGLGGVSTTIDMVKTYWGHKIKRYILGQTLSSEAEATGMGSGVADAHLATLADIVKYDSVNLEESITDDYLRPLQLWNFPASSHVNLFLRIDTEDPDARGKMEGFKNAWDMGLKLKASDVADVIGASMPDPDDEILENPALQAAAANALNVPADADADGIAGEGTGQAQIVAGNDGATTALNPAAANQKPLDLGEAVDQASANGSAMKRSHQGRHMQNRMMQYLQRANGATLTR